VDLGSDLLIPAHRDKNGIMEARKIMRTAKLTKFKLSDTLKVENNEKLRTMANTKSAMGIRALFLKKMTAKDLFTIDLISKDFHSH